MMLTKFMGRLEKHYVISVKGIQFTRRIHKLTLYLIVFSLKQVQVIPSTDCLATKCHSEKLGSGIAH